MAEPIKLLIWDLDDTFWQGTLSEGAITAVEENLALVRATAARGLVHTIVSKNDLAPVEAKLTELGIRDLFVFLRVSWQPKGPIIRELLDAMQLRAPNALFIDDNAVNRREAEFYNPGLQTIDPADLPAMSAQLRASGKPDPELSRLKQYQLLERQQQARAQYEGDNLAFLRAAQVKIEFQEGAALVPDLARIEELINRSNQLNFTKRRVTKEELAASFTDSTLRWGSVRVRDEFGDYGLVGVYCVNVAGQRLEQFVFSCRILHLGIEQFTYTSLGFPALEVQGEVATELNSTDHPDWIEVVEEMPALAEEPRAAYGAGSAPSKARLRVLLKGGCDLGQLTPFLQAFDLDVDEEFNYLNENQITAHLEHTILLRHTRELAPAEQQRLARRLPFLGEDAFQTKLWAGGYDALVFSPLMDYTQDLYRERATGLAIAFGGYLDLTAQNLAELARRYAQRRFRGMDEDFLRQFAQDFEFAGPISPGRFAENLKWLRQQIPAALPIFFLNGAEIEVPGSVEAGAAQRHAFMNAALEDFARQAPNCFVVDVRPFINQRADVTNNLRHYQPRHYRTLAQRVAEAIGQWQGQQLSRSAWVDLQARLKNLIPAKLRNALGR
jgi:FkbH-like protein